MTWKSFSSIESVNQRVGHRIILAIIFSSSTLSSRPVRLTVDGRLHFVKLIPTLKLSHLTITKYFVLFVTSCNVNTNKKTLQPIFIPDFIRRIVIWVVKSYSTEVRIFADLTNLSKFK